MKAVPTASAITIREVLALFDKEFSAVADAVEAGEFALWVGSGISRNAPDLGGLLDRALEFLRAGATNPATAGRFRPAFEEALHLADVAPADVAAQLHSPFSTWPQRATIRGRLWNKYSRVLDIRVKGEPADFILWEAIDIRSAFSPPGSPAAEHLCIAVLVLEGAVRTIASANWDAFIESAVRRLSGGAPGVLQVVVDPDHLRDAAGKAQLLKFHGCIEHATTDPVGYRRYLIGSYTQILEWPGAPAFAAMRNALTGIATTHKALVLGLSIQDINLQGLFATAKQLHPWPWPCSPQAPAHVFCEDEIKQGQIDVLKVVYGDAYGDHIDAIQASAHLRAWGVQALMALCIRLVADKLLKLMALCLDDVGKPAINPPLAALLKQLRDHVADMADLASADRTGFTNSAIALWSRLASIFRHGTLPAHDGVYEHVSSSIPSALAADENAQAAALGRLGVALSLLEHGRSSGLWELKPAQSPDISSGALTARAAWTGALDRPLFVVRSAAEAIVLGRNGALASDDAVVLHADTAWHELGGGSTRRPGAAPGRTGKVGTIHVSVGHLLENCVDANSLMSAFVTGVTL